MLCSQLLGKITVMSLYCIEYGTMLSDGLFGASLCLNGDITGFFYVVVEV